MWTEFEEGCSFNESSIDPILIIVSVVWEPGGKVGGFDAVKEMERVKNFMKMWISSVKDFF